MKLLGLPQELVLEIINRLPSDLVLQLYEDAKMRIPFKVTKRILEEKLRLQPYNNGIYFKEYSIFLKSYNSHTLDYVTGNITVNKLLVIKYNRYNENIYLGMFIKCDGEELEYNV